MAGQQHGEMASPNVPHQEELASTAKQPHNAHLDSKRKRSTSLASPEDDHASGAPTDGSAGNNKRPKLDTAAKHGVSCQPRCGYPLKSALHEHRPWCHSNVPVVETSVRKIFDEFLADVQPHLDRVSKSVSAKCESIRASKDIKRRYPEPKPTAVVGETGYGKSRIVNGILDDTDLATTSASGRGTHTTLEFRGPDEDQDRRFVLKVLLQKPAQIRQRLREYLSTIYTCVMMKKQQSTNDGLGNEDEDEDDELDDGEIDDQLQKYDNAYEMLYTTLYGSKLTLMTKGKSREHKIARLRDFQEFMDSRFNGFAQFEDSDPDGTSAMMCDRIMEFTRAQGVSDDTKICAVNSLADLEKVMHETIQPLSAEGQHLWPLVRKAILHCEGIKLLELGVSIGDTAGFSDTNEFVVNNSLSYLANARTTLLVAPVARIASREDLNTHLTRSITMGKADSIYVVATHADLLDSELKVLQREVISTEDEARISSAEEQEKRQEDKIKQLQDEKDKLSAQESEARSRIDAEIADLQDRKAKATRAKVRAVRQIEKAKIEQQLKDRLRRLTRSGHGPDLQVFFTSSLALDRCRKTGQSICEDEMLDTGVAAITQLLFDKAALEKFDVLWRTCTNRLPSELRAVLAMLTKSPTQMHQDVRATIAMTFDKGIERVITALQNETKSRITGHLATAFTGDRKKKWASTAGVRLKHWGAWHGRTVYAFCRRMGIWKDPDTNARISWTGIIQNIFAKTVARAFDQIDTAGASIIESLTNNVEEFILMPLKTDARIASLGEEGNTLAETITDQSEEWSTDLKDLASKLKRSLDKIRSRTVIDETKYTHEELQSTYVHAAGVSTDGFKKVRKAKRLVKGKTAHANRFHALREKLCVMGDNNIFQRVQARAEGGLEEASKKWVGNVRAKLEEVKMAVLADFDNRYDNQEEAKKVDPKAAQAVYDAAMVAKTRLEEEVLPLLEECKKLEDRVPKGEGQEGV